MGDARYLRRMPRMSFRDLRLLSVVAVAAAALSFSTTASSSPTASAASKRCGTFKSGYTYTVYRYAGSVKCKTAVRIVKSFIVDHEKWRSHGDGTSAGTSYTSSKFPGWRCGEGSGGDSCSKGKTTIGYQN